MIINLIFLTLVDFSDYDVLDFLLILKLYIIQHEVKRVDLLLKHFPLFCNFFLCHVGLAITTHLQLNGLYSFFVVFEVVLVIMLE